MVDASSPSSPSSPSSLSPPSVPSDPSSSSSPSVPSDPPSNPDERLVQARQECRWRARQHHVARRAAAAASAEMLRPGLSDHQTLLVATASEPGVSSWFTASPSSATSTVLSKRDFRDAIAIRYGFALFDLAERCACGEALTIHHAFVCPAGGYPSARHNELRDLLAAALGEVVSDVELEPRLLPLTDESLPFRTCNRDAEARVDIRARGFWARQQEAFFDVRVTHPKASLLSRSEVRSQLLSHERAKKRHYAILYSFGICHKRAVCTGEWCFPESIGRWHRRQKCGSQLLFGDEPPPLPNQLLPAALGRYVPPWLKVILPPASWWWPCCGVPSAGTYCELIQ